MSNIKKAVIFRINVLEGNRRIARVKEDTIVKFYGLILGGLLHAAEIGDKLRLIIFARVANSGFPLSFLTGYCGRRL